MSIMIKCDGNDNCQNFDGCCEDRVYPLFKEVRSRFPLFSNVEHLCESCMDAELCEGSDLVFMNHHNKHIRIFSKH